MQAAKAWRGRQSGVTSWVDFLASCERVEGVTARGREDSVKGETEGVDWGSEGVQLC